MMDKRGNRRRAAEEEECPRNMFVRTRPIEILCNSSRASTPMREKKANFVR